MARYLVKYRVLPPGLGPDDYEPADLPLHEDEFELSDPEPAGTVAGKDLHYAPHHNEVAAAVQERLAVGEQPIIIRYNLA